MELTEQEINRREEQIPEQAGQATRQAYQRAVASGHPVTVVIGDEIVRVQTTDTGIQQESTHRTVRTRRIQSRHFRIA